VVCILNTVSKQRDYGIFECRLGHRFKRQMHLFKKNSKCPTCEKERKKEEYRSKFISNVNSSGFEFVSGYTSGKTSPVALRCLKCNNVFTQKADSFIKNRRCPHCKFAATKKSKRLKTIHEIANQNNIEVVKYAPGKYAELTFRCKNGHVFTKSQKIFRDRPVCTECTKLERHKKSDAMFRDRLKKYSIEVLSSDLIATNKTPFTMKCSNGHVYENMIASMHPAYGCKYCKGDKNSETKHFQIDQVIKNLESVGKSIGNY